MFNIELIKIKGQRKPAWKCNVATLEGCDKRMKAYVRKSQKEFLGDRDAIEEEVSRLTKSVNTDMDENLLIWINMRVYLLQQMMVGSTIDEFRADELGEEL